jgi:hypothetical protein
MELPLSFVSALHQTFQLCYFETEAVKIFTLPFQPVRFDIICRLPWKVHGPAGSVLLVS